MNKLWYWSAAFEIPSSTMVACQRRSRFTCFFRAYAQICGSPASKRKGLDFDMQLPNSMQEWVLLAWCSLWRHHNCRGWSVDDWYCTWHALIALVLHTASKVILHLPMSYMNNNANTHYPLHFAYVKQGHRLLINQHLTWPQQYCQSSCPNGLRLDKLPSGFWIYLKPGQERAMFVQTASDFDTTWCSLATFVFVPAG